MEKKESKEEERIREGIRKGKAENLVSVPFSRFPMMKWEEWNDDCRKNFNGVRWMKAYADHLKAKNSIENQVVWKKIEEIEAKLIVLTEQPEEKEEETVSTLGGGEHE